MKAVLIEDRRGFTLIEMLVVVTIIAVLTGVIMTFVFDGRKESRDQVRIADLQQYKLTVRLYEEAHDAYPVYDEGIELGVGEAIDSDLGSFVGQMRADPIADSGGGGSYGYLYDSDFLCNGESHIILAARTMENEKYGNVTEVCGAGTYSSLGEYPHVVIVQ